MNIICPECGKIHKLPDNQLPDRKSVARCKKCGGRMIINSQPSAKDLGEINQEIKPVKQNKPEPREPDVLLADNHDVHEKKDPLFSLEESRSEENLTAYDDEKVPAENEIYAAFPELAELSPDKFAYAEIFSSTEKRGYQTRQNNINLKVVKAVHDILTTKVLQKNEQVMRLARGIAYYPSEILYANGLLTMLSNYFAIICTTKRLLFINIDSRTRHPTRYIFQVPYEEIYNVGRGAFLSSIIIENSSGRSWNFTTIRRNLAKSIRDFILEKSKGEPAGPENGPSLCQLCPSCYTPLPGGLSSCSHCSAPFKKPTEAVIRSLILPGLGSIYLSYLPLGIMEMAGYLAIWLLAVVLMVMTIPGGIITAMAPVLTYHLITGILSRKTTGKGYLLENSHVNQTAESDVANGDMTQRP